MRRKKRGLAISGVVLVDKPAGMTSNQVVQRVKRLYNGQKAGHTGTLDPFATGLLPVCLGEATKVSAYQLDADKTYDAVLTLGSATDTADCEGEVIETAAVPPLFQLQVEAVLHQLIGPMAQLPPAYSALKVNGKPLYKYARAGQSVEIEPRQVMIHDLTLLKLDGHQLHFRTRVSKGTYVRTLGEDIAKALGTVGHLSALRRLETGGLNVQDALSLEAIEAHPDQALLGLEVLVPHLPRYAVSAGERETLQRGNPIVPANPLESGALVLVTAQAQPVCVGEYRDKQLWPKRVFNL